MATRRSATNQHIREYIEETITNRLLKDKPGDVKVTQHEFRTMATWLGGTYQVVLSNTAIPGFTDDDLLSFMFMKTHQLLKTGIMLDLQPGKNPNKLFYYAFTNLMRDIVRMYEAAERRGLYHDPLDTRIPQHLEEDRVDMQVIITYTTTITENV